MIKLVIQDDEGKTTIVPMIRDEITVGRKEGNTIRLTERNVSRKHARILQDNGSIVVEDLNSYNGVRVNGSRIQGRVGLNVSDRIQIGDYLIELKADAAVVPVDVYDEETRPVETVSPQVLATAPIPVSSPGLAVPQPAVGENDATTKMTAPATAMLKAATMSSPDLGAPAEHAGMQQTAPAAGPPARVVLLSTNLAGQEFELTRPAMVIGRTDDNDVTVNHRSISRHHAKIVCENGRYAIVDLQSSNGVRVNGEEYSKVELRRGDVVDLGHVRMRFVEPGEDFLFGRDAHAVVVPGGGNRKFMYAALAVLLLGGVAIFALTRGSGDEKSDSESSTRGDAPATDAVKPDDDTSSKTKAVQENLSKIKPLIDLAKTSIEKEKWSAALEAAKSALQIQPDSREAKELAKTAEFEEKNKDLYDAFKKAVTNDDYIDIGQSFAGIDDNSLYKDKARQAHDDKRDNYIRDATVQAKSLANKNKCSELSELRVRAASAWEQAGDAVANVPCDAAVAVKKPDDKKSDKKKSDDKKPDKKSDKKKSDKKSDKKPSKSYDQLMADAKAAMFKNQYGKSRRLCDDALKLKPRDAGAATVCGLAACNMKKARLAKKYYNMLPAQRKNMVRQSCLTRGVTDLQ